MSPRHTTYPASDFHVLDSRIRIRVATFILLFFTISELSLVPFINDDGNFMSESISHTSQLTQVSAKYDNIALSTVWSLAEMSIERSISDRYIDKGRVAYRRRYLMRSTIMSTCAIS